MKEFGGASSCNGGLVVSLELSIQLINFAVRSVRKARSNSHRESSNYGRKSLVLDETPQLLESESNCSQCQPTDLS